MNTDTTIKVTLRTGLLELKPGQVIEGGNIILSSNAWVVSHPVIIADPMFITEPTKQVNTIEHGILMISDLIIESGNAQDIIEYQQQKPRVVIHSGGVVQFIVQDASYLLGKTQTSLPWELAIASVPTRTILRIN